MQQDDSLSFHWREIARLLDLFERLAAFIERPRGVDLGRLHVALTMTSAACPVADLILEEVESELDRAVPEGTQIDVELVWEPPWSTERMSPRAKAFMGW